MSFNVNKNRSGLDPICEPKVGIFWYLNKGLVTYSMPVFEVAEKCGFRDVEMGHYQFWPTLQKLDKSLRNLDYDAVPRGRVLYDASINTFKVYSSSQMIQKTDFKELVLKIFNLPESTTVFESDLHYESPEGNSDE